MSQQQQQQQQVVRRFINVAAEGLPFVVDGDALVRGLALGPHGVEALLGGRRGGDGWSAELVPPAAVVFMVEKWLDRFLSEDRMLTLFFRPPPEVSAACPASYALLRAVVLRHLRRLSEGDSAAVAERPGRFDVMEFGSVDEYLAEVRDQAPSFVLLDGDRDDALLRRLLLAAPAAGGAAPAAAPARRVVLTEGLVFQPGAIKGFEVLPVEAADEEAVDVELRDAPDVDLSAPVAAEDVAADAEVASAAGLLPHRPAPVVPPAEAAALLPGCPFSAVVTQLHRETGSELQARLWLLHFALLRALPVRARAPETARPLDAHRVPWLPAAVERACVLALPLVDAWGAGDGTPDAGLVVDLYDPRLLALLDRAAAEQPSLLRSAASVGLGPAAAEQLEAAWRLTAPGCKSGFFPVVAAGQADSGKLFADEVIGRVARVRAGLSRARELGKAALAERKAADAAAAPSPSAPQASASSQTGKPQPKKGAVAQKEEEEEEEEEPEDVADDWEAEVDDWETAADSDDGGKDKKKSEVPKQGAGDKEKEGAAADSQEQHQVLAEDVPSLTQVACPMLTTISADWENRLVELGFVTRPAPSSHAGGNQAVADEAKHWTAGKLLLDGLLREEKAETERQLAPTTNRRELRRRMKMSRRQLQRDAKFMEKAAQSLAGGKMVLRELVMAEPQQAAAEQHATKGGGKGGHHGGGGGGGGGGGKSRGPSRAELIRAETEARQDEELMNTTRIAVEEASRRRTVEAKIAHLEQHLQNISLPKAAVPALMQVLDWCEEAAQEVRPQSGDWRIVRLFFVMQDILRRFMPHCTPRDMARLLRLLVTRFEFVAAARRVLAEYLNLAVVPVPQAEAAKLRALLPPEAPGAAGAAGAHAGGRSCAMFQVQHASHVLVRDTGSTRDPRTGSGRFGFCPDDWQRRLLDIVDASESALVFAPTSSGKTFVSFYVMKKVLEYNRADRKEKRPNMFVVYVAPTKALVNQVAAEVYARYGTVYGTFTLDYKHNWENCEILITVPECLELLFLAPTRAEWASRLQFAIFDEIHSIGESEVGAVWERTLLMLPCPFLGLSATIGRHERLHEWIETVQQHRLGPNTKVHVVQVPDNQRWTDLATCVYVGDSHHDHQAVLTADGIDHTSQGVERKNARSWQPPLPPPVVSVAADAVVVAGAGAGAGAGAAVVAAGAAAGHGGQARSQLVPLHPLETLLQHDGLQRGGIPDHLHMSPAEALQLYNVMVQTAGSAEQRDRLRALSVSQWFDEHFGDSLVVTQKDARAWAREVSAELRRWPIEQVLRTVRRMRASAGGGLARLGEPYHPKPEVLLRLMLDLHMRNMLPAIVFIFDRVACERTAEGLVALLEKAQEETLAAEGAGKKEPSRAEVDRRKKMRDGKDRRSEEEKLDDRDFEPDAEVVHPGGVDPRFSFLREGQLMAKQDRDYWLDRLKWKTHWTEEHPLVRALYRGIGVHHSNIHKTYRDVVEAFLRGGHLAVVIATDTLAQGINAPCRTTVMFGDAPRLNALIYRQCSGRAGRRGYDNAGNIVFCGLSARKVAKLLCSPLPRISGHFLLSTTLVLRLHALHAAVPPHLRPQAIASARALVESPLYCYDDQKNAPAGGGGGLSEGAGALVQQVRHHFRFCTDLLVRLGLLGASDGRPAGLAGLAAHLHQYDPYNLALLVLLQRGVLRACCEDFKKDRDACARRLMLIMCHLFYRVPVDRSTMEQVRQMDRDRTQSMVRLPDLEEAEAADRILAAAAPSAVWRSLNGQIRDLFVEYTRGFFIARDSVEDRAAAGRLPLSGLAFQDPAGTGAQADAKTLVGLLQLASPPVEVRSPLAALAGGQPAGDTFANMGELLAAARGGVRVDEDVVPVAPLSSDEGVHLNAYALDYYRHGMGGLIIRDNRIRESDAWYKMKDWNTLLQSIATALEELTVYSTVDPVVGAFRHLADTFDARFSSFNEEDGVGASAH